jgi:hypothetical protein
MKAMGIYLKPSETESYKDNSGMIDYNSFIQAYKAN